jgi:hypothetical protein
VYAASIPSMRACPECGWLEVEIGSTWISLPGCPKCRRQLAPVSGELPISVSHAECKQHFYLDASGMLYRRPSPFPVGAPPGCSRCGTWLSRSENLPARGHCPKCDQRYLLDPIRPVEPCSACGGVIELTAGVMPAQGVCSRCTRKVVLGTSPKPIRGRKARARRASGPDAEKSDAESSKIDWDEIKDFAVAAGHMAFGIAVTLAALAAGLAALAAGGYIAWSAFQK